MAKQISTITELLEIYINEVKANSGDLTDFSEGSLHDIIAGAFAVGVNEVSEYISAEFKKTFFDTAAGPEVTGGEDELEKLAIDHYDEAFARPPATKATVDITFSRPTAGAGDVTIPAGTVVKTKKDASGVEIPFSTLEEAILTGLTLDVTAESNAAGLDQNVAAGSLTVLESALTDPTITVTNASQAAGGDDEEDDATYRETIRSLINSLAGATKAAIRGALLAVPEIELVSLIEIGLPVIQWDIGGSQPEPGEVYFRIPFPKAYVADANGASSAALIQKAYDAILDIRACGVNVVIEGAVASSLDWTASYTLNPSGPNYAELSASSQKVTDSMRDYIDSNLEIGDGFSRANAKAHIMGIWGPAGTNDLTNFTNVAPVGDIAGVAGTKLIAGTMEIQ